MPIFLENKQKKLRNTYICTNFSPHFCISFIIVPKFPKKKDWIKQQNYIMNCFSKKTFFFIKFKGLVYK